MSRTCSTIQMIYHSCHPNLEGKEKGDRPKKYLNYSWTLCKFGKRQKPTYSRSWLNPRIKPKKSMPRYIINSLKTKDKDFEISERETFYLEREKTVWMIAGFSSETTEAEGSGTTFFKC